MDALYLVIVLFQSDYNCMCVKIVQSSRQVMRCVYNVVSYLGATVTTNINGYQAIVSYHSNKSCKHHDESMRCEYYITCIFAA